MNELALFAGAGGGILGGHLLGWRTVCAVEWEPYPASVLCARQNDKILPPFPIWDDVQTFDGKPWRGIVDVVSGGFPCQDISAAGKGAGITGSRSSMWKHMARIIGEVRPQYVFVENSPMLVTRGLNVVLADLPRWGLMQDGALYPQQTLVQTIKENEFGLEPNNETFFHTPNTTGMDGGSNSRKALKKRLEWPTPNTLEGLAPKKLERIMEYNNKSRPGRSYASMNLREQVVYGKVQIWPTPQARDHKGSSGRSNTGQELDLPTKVKMLPTPTSSEHKYRLQGESQASRCLEAQARRGELEAGDGGTLNPTWVEWLMGWPLGWTDLKPLVMDKSLYVQQQHGSYLNE